MPKKWHHLRLGEFLERQSVAAPIDPDADYKRLTVAINGRGVRERDTVKGRDLGSARYRLTAGDLVVSKIDARKGAAAILPPNLDGVVVTGDFPSYRVDRARVTTAYLDLVVRRPEFADLCDSISGGTTNRVRMDLERFPDLEIAVPPLEEQHRIVDLTRAVDAYVAAADARVEAARVTRSAILDDLLSKSENTWTRFKVRDLSVKNGLVGGPFGSSLVTKDYATHGVPVIRGQNLPDSERYVAGEFVFVTEAKAETLNRNLAIPGDIVVTQRGTLGQVAIVPDEQFSRYVVSQSQMRLRVDPAIADRDFVYLWLDWERTRRAIDARKSVTANPHINLGLFGDLEGFLPPLPIQREIVKSLAPLDDCTNAATQCAHAARILRSALLSDLLSGNHEIPPSYDRFLEAA